MKRLAIYLQKYLDGEVMTGQDVCDYYATDSSVLKVKPQIVIYPKHEQDIQDIMSWCSQLAIKKKVIPVTCRSGGTNTLGASLGSHIVLALNTHLNNLIEYDSRRGSFRLQAGANLEYWQQFLSSQYRFFPPTKNPYPTATIGGAVANNSGCYYSTKYGRVERYVKKMKVVLSNGELITVRRLSRRELLEKTRFDSFEGEIYRQLIQLQATNRDKTGSLKVDSTSGYNFEEVSGPHNSFSLIPLFVGSQGTLGIITEIELRTTVLNPTPLSAIISSPNLKDGVALIAEIKKLRPASIEIFNQNYVRAVNKITPRLIETCQIDPSKTDLVIVVEFDMLKFKKSNRQMKKLEKLSQYYNADCQVMFKLSQQQIVERLRRSSSFLLAEVGKDGERYLPGFEDVQVPLDCLFEFIKEAKTLFGKAKIDFILSGSVGCDQIQVLPKANLSGKNDKDVYIKLLSDYLKLVIKHNGKLSCFKNLGRLKSHYLKLELNSDLMEVQTEIKKIFDPLNLLNPGVKINGSRTSCRQRIQTKFKHSNIWQYLPHY